MPILLASIRVKEVKARYDNIDIMSGRSNTEAENLLMQPGGVQYPITMQIPTDMQPPVTIWLSDARSAGAFQARSLRTIHVTAQRF